MNNCALHAYPNESQSKRLVRLIAKQDSEYTYISVEDNGCGICDEDQSKIFEPFFTTLRAKGGTGLGMHMVYNVCTQKLRGSINLESSLGEGARFTIQLDNRLVTKERAPAI